MNKHRKGTLKERLLAAAEKAKALSTEEGLKEPTGKPEAEAYEHANKVPYAEFDFDEHFRKLELQAQAAQQFYPDLDLKSELRNPLFARLTQPQVGMEVAEAYAIAHREKLMEAMMAYAVERARESISLAVQAGSLRPMENGVGAAVQPVQEDPRNWSPQRRKEMKERLRRGERITF